MRKIDVLKKSGRLYMIFVFLLIILLTCNQVIQSAGGDSNKEITEIKYDTQLYSLVDSEISFDKLMHNADLVIEGEIKDILYYTYDGIAWTKLKVKITQNYICNTFEEEISIYVLGGYIDAREYNKYYNVDLRSKTVHVLETNINNCYTVGEKIMAVLIKTDPNSPFEKSAYEGLIGNKSMYLIDNQGYYTYHDNDEKCYLTNQEIALLNNENG